MSSRDSKLFHSSLINIPVPGDLHQDMVWCVIYQDLSKMFTLFYHHNAEVSPVAHVQILVCYIMYQNIAKISTVFYHRKAEV